MTDRTVEELESDWVNSQDRPADDLQRIDNANALAWMIGLQQRERSIALATEAKTASEAQHYVKGIAEATRTLAYTHLLEGEHQICLSMMAEAEQQFRSVNELEGLASVLDIQFNIYHQLAAYKEALNAALECLSISKQLGLRRQEAWALHNMGVALYEGGDPEAAEHKVLEALKIFEDMNYLPGLGRSSERLGVIYEFLGTVDKAVHYTQAAMSYSEQYGFALGKGGASIQYARLLDASGRRDEAREALNHALVCFDELKRNPGTAQIHLQLGQMAMRDGNLHEAREHFEHGFAVLEGGAVVTKQLKLHEAMVELSELCGDTERALHHSKEALRTERIVHDAENARAVRNLKIQMETERERQQSEIHRLRYVELKNMHSRLVETEKLAVLGDLAAGLAHEANTPLGVLGSNIDLARRAAERLRDDDETKRARGERAMNRALDTAEIARSRLQELVESLKRFVRLDEAELMLVDVREGIESALTLLASRVPQEMTVQRMYAEQLPEVKAHPGELNQAFMNLLVHGLEHGREQLRVSIEPHDEGIRVLIAYDGEELSETERTALFDLQFEARDDKMRLQVTLPAVASTLDRYGGRVRAVAGPAFEVILSA